MKKFILGNISPFQNSNTKKYEKQMIVDKTREFRSEFHIENT